MGARGIINGFLIAFGIVVILTFAYGGYLMRLRRTTADAAFAASGQENLETLLHTGAIDLERKHAEQALLSYRRALTLATNSIDAQLGIARGELMAGRETVAAREYERVLVLEPGN